jgi:hypothetical protein
MKVYKWKKDASEAHVELHLKSLNAAIKYKTNHGLNCDELEEESTSFLKFYYNGEKKRRIVF